MKPSCLSAFLLAFLLFWSGGAARAASPSATASLSSNQGKVGDGIELEVKVEGTQSVSPAKVEVDGLNISYVGQSSQFSWTNGQSSQSIRYTYLITPRKAGSYTIPALTFDAKGVKFSTAPLQLVVTGGGNQPAGGSSPASAATPRNEGDFAYAQWVLPKTTVYVGEAIPAELWLYVDKRTRCQLQQVTAKSDGFSIALQKMDRLQTRDVEKDGREMILAVIKLAITPVKAGKLTLEPAEINAIAVLPQQRPRRSRMPGGLDDFLNDPLFNQAFNVQQQVTIRPGSVEMEVKPLPTAGKPADFSGAIGQFTLETKAAPTRVKAGDPVTLTAVVKGIGSFDRMNAPTTADVPGWRAYPPSGKFQQDDAVGISGAKTFETALIPEEKQAELPPVTFSFFNPSSGKYETLKATPIAVNVEGALPPTSPVTAAAAATPGQPAAAPTPTPAPRDIQYLRTDLGRASVSGFAPVWQTRLFWIAQGAAALALAAFGAWQWRRARNGNGLRQRTARLHREKEKAQALIRREGVAAPEFFDAAIRVIQIETALARLPEALEPATIDAELACSSRALECETAEGVRRIFAAHDELRYAGSGAAAPIAPDQRGQVLQILEAFETCHV
ncbi:MAG: BatD family protein [Chthoniobacteraceae bacterium]